MPTPMPTPDAPAGGRYDTAMLEANTFIGSYYVTALRAASRMARLMDDAALATSYEQRASLASASYDRICWREEYGYYVADVDIKTCRNASNAGWGG